MTCSSRSVQRSMVWVWRLRTRTASRRISQVGHWCASWRTGVRRFLVSSSTIQVNGSYDRHSRRLSRLCASAREKPRAPDDLSGGRGSKPAVLTQTASQIGSPFCVVRGTAADDRRRSTNRITAAGKALLNRLDRDVADAAKQTLGHLGRTRLTALRDVLVAFAPPPQPSELP